MATNLIKQLDEAPGISLVCSDPTTPASGGPVRFGEMTGVAETNEDSDGYTTVNLGLNVWDLSVKGVNDSGNSAVAVGDALFYVDADTPKLSKKSSGRFFGFALEAVGSGSTDTINVLHVPSPGAGTLGAGTIGLTNIQAGSLDGTIAANKATSNVVGALGLIHMVTVPDAAGDVDVTLTHKTKVINAWFVKAGGNGGAGCTLQVLNSASAITEAFDASGTNDTVIGRFAQINDANSTINAGGTLRVTAAKSAGNIAAEVFVLGIRVA